MEMRVLSLPLAVASFLFFHVVKSVLVSLRRLRDARTESLEWRTISEMLRLPLSLPYIMVTGPRWNPHAIIAGAGPFRLERSLQVGVETALQSAKMWTAVIYSAADSSTIASIDRNSVEPGAMWSEQVLPPGTYSVVLRYYGWNTNPVLPKIQLDGERVIPSRPVPATENDYLKQIRGRNTAFYRMLQYYVLPMLRLRDRLPESFVRREYLPVGNPRTTFHYGVVGRGQRLAVSCTAEATGSFQVFACVYNHCSFPVFWEEIANGSFVSAPAEERGFYLVRVHAKRADSGEPPVGGIKVAVQ
jgi:hypothetical protein